MASKKKATKKTKKKVTKDKLFDDLPAQDTDLFVELSSEPKPAVEPAVQGEYTWKAYYGDAPDQSLFAAGLVCGTLLGFAITMTGLIINRLLA